MDSGVSAVKDATGACERSDLLDRTTKEHGTLACPQNNSVVLGRPLPAPSLESGT